ncbi:hypothetical protein C900_05861 [Fulvivirga imtechensis AK7]|uniref:Secretion system C-terminal sorting domain-containing protein n=1 Tax=Fulvivirga imtechensis AK7 TaxID=1237149 RepID=L8JJ00_9BACT|nr:T9SS type A sorting domain-containing protein [Fulvivirga imtechensis]ELR68765.1 hypothetical protein C900_05861 [Fulvivirga imtechensis AK7]
MNFKSLITIILLFVAFGIEAQITENEYEKYWYYRNRLVKEFMVPGLIASCGYDAGGYSIPAEKTFNLRDHSIVWSDGTLFQGYYIGLLATEYRLLKDAGWDTSETEKELYYAMKAYERIDTRSAIKGVEGTPNQCLQNGYFIRDDVEPLIFDDNPVFQKYIRNGNYSFNSKYKEMQATNANPVFVRNLTPDQVQPLMVGFALVKKCIEPDKAYSGYNFVNNAMNYADDIASYLNSVSWFDRNEAGNIMGSDKKTWRTFRTEGHGYITAWAANYVSPQPGGPLSYLSSLSGFRISNMMWALLAQQWLLKRDKLKDYVAGHMGAGIAVGNAGHGWSQFSTHGIVNELDGSARYDFGLYKLLLKYLYNETDHVIDRKWHEDLRQAPCYGIQLAPTNMDENHAYFEGKAPWRAMFKFLGGDERNGDPYNLFKWMEDQGWNPNPIDFQSMGKFNGIDYMLFYNLYCLYYKNVNTAYVGNIPSLMPKFNLKISSNESVTQDLHSYNTVTFSSTLNYSGSRNLSAAENISLKPGFSATASSSNELHFYITGPTNACGDQLDEFGELLNPSSASTQMANKESIGSRMNEELIAEQPVINEVHTKKDKDYKPLDEYLNERATNSKNDVFYTRTEIFPNPFSENEFRVKMFGADDEAEFVLYNNLGERLHFDVVRESFGGISQYQFKVNGSIPDGFYFLQISSNGKQQVVKLLKK